MSYDTSLYFRTPEFPMEQWIALISDRNPAEREVIPTIYNTATAIEWTISSDAINGAGLWLTLYNLNLGNRIHPPQTYWEISISHGGHRPKDYYFHFRFCYEVLLLLPGTLFYDSQRDTFAETAEEIREFASKYLQYFGRAKMFKLGLMDGEGNVLF